MARLQKSPRLTTSAISTPIVTPSIKTTESAPKARVSKTSSWDAAPRRNVDVPEGLWLKCPSCSEMIYRKTMEENLHTCPDCHHHFRVDARQRIAMLVDPGSFEEMDENVRPRDILSFSDKK